MRVVGGLDQRSGRVAGRALASHAAKRQASISHSHLISTDESDCACEREGEEGDGDEALELSSGGSLLGVGARRDGRRGVCGSAGGSALPPAAAAAGGPGAGAARRPRVPRPRRRGGHGRAEQGRLPQGVRLRDGDVGVPGRGRGDHQRPGALHLGPLRPHPR